MMLVPGRSAIVHGPEEYLTYDEWKTDSLGCYTDQRKPSRQALMPSGFRGSGLSGATGQCPMKGFWFPELSKARRTVARRCSGKDALCGGALGRTRTCDPRLRSRQWGISNRWQCFANRRNHSRHGSRRSPFVTAISPRFVSVCYNVATVREAPRTRKVGRFDGARGGGAFPRIDGDCLCDGPTGGAARDSGEQRNPDRGSAMINSDTD
jgi:hypothetical protein